MAPMSAAPEPEKDKAAEGGDAPKPKGSKLPLIVAIVNTVGLLGLGAFVALSKGKDDTKDAKAGKGGKDAHAVASAAAADHGDEHGGSADEHGDGDHGDGDHAAAPDAHGKTLIVPLGVFVINLKDPGGEKYLKAKIGLEVAGEGEVKKEAEGKVSKVRYEILMVLSDLRVVDVSGPEKIETLKKVMLQKAKKALAPGIKVVGIYPEEWVIQ